MSGLALDLFAGAGGWSVAARELGITEVGIELDAAACATRATAGHKTIRADVAAFGVSRLGANIDGIIGSPVCVMFSAAGTRAGNLVLDELASSIRDLFAGRPTRAAHRREMVRSLRQSRWLAGAPVPQMDAATWRRKHQAGWKRKLLARKGSPAKLRRQISRAPAGPHLTRAQRSARIWESVRSASLVVEPARFIAACSPEWVALEQVPSVLPLWRVYAAELSRLGYSAWCGILDAANFGVPQTRERAILIASRTRRVARPEATHYDPRKGMQLWGTPWVSMADALGWGATGRAAPTVTAGGTATGGAEPFGHRDRDALAAEREAGQWVLRAGNRPHATVRPAPAPAPAMAFGHNSARMQWVLHTNRGQDEAGNRQTRDPSSAPALTAKSGGQWSVKAFRNNNNNNNACVRSPDEPAGTLFFGGRSNWAAFVGEANESIRITVQEAAILQSFPPDYPWQGAKTKQFQCVGNAVPPLLAAHVLAEATGLRAEWLAA